MSRIPGMGKVRSSVASTRQFSQKIRDPQVYQGASDLIKSGKFPSQSVTILKRGTELQRTIDIKWMSTPLEAITARHESRTTDWNRSSGMKPDGTPGTAAIYLGSTTGVLAESYHYAVKAMPHALVPYGIDARDFVMASKVRYVYEVNSDLSLLATDNPELLRRLSQESPELRDYIAAKMMKDDYSLDRGLSQGAVGVHDLKGVTFKSHRAEPGDDPVDSSAVAMHADVGTPLLQFLTPKRLEICTYDTDLHKLVTQIYPLSSPALLGSSGGQVVEAVPSAIFGAAERHRWSNRQVLPADVVLADIPEQSGRS